MRATRLAAVAAGPDRRRNGQGPYPVGDSSAEPPEGAHADPEGADQSSRAARQARRDVPQARRRHLMQLRHRDRHTAVMLAALAVSITFGLAACGSSDAKGGPTSPVTVAVATTTVATQPATSVHTVPATTERRRPLMPRLQRPMARSRERCRGRRHGEAARRDRPTSRRSRLGSQSRLTRTDHNGCVRMTAYR